VAATNPAGTLGTRGSVVPRCRSGACDAADADLLAPFEVNIGAVVDALDVVADFVELGPETMVVPS
jgi:hypothetical protein